MQENDTHSPVPGDILLFAGTGWLDTIVERATHGPYSHAAIVFDDRTMIEAVNHGVTRSPLQTADALLRTGAALDKERLAHALTWLEHTLGDAYAWWAIAADGVKALLPAAVSRTPFLVAPSQYDCSQLAAQFLLVAGFMWPPDGWYRDSARISPNDLAEALKQYSSPDAQAA